MTAQEFINTEEYWRVSQDIDTIRAMIQFAKYHVEKALKFASENVEGHNSNNDSSSDVYIDKDSILTAYDLNQIK
jgi:hypothetical protein